MRKGPAAALVGGEPPPGVAPGEDWRRLAGFAGAVLGWPPDRFWAATPAELTAVVAALAGDGAAAPADGALLARLREEMPDG